MPRQCRNPKCIGSKKSLTSHKYKNKEKDPRPSSTSRPSSSDDSTSRNKRSQKPRSKRSRDGSKNSRTSSRDHKNKKRQVSRSTSESSTSTSTYSSRKSRTTSTESNTFRKVSGSSRGCKKQICTCHKESRGTRSGNSHGHANSRSTDPMERSKRRRKRSRRRRKKASKRESDRPRRDCFATLCACVRGRSSDELGACKCTSSPEISSHCECYSVKGRQEGMKQVTRKNTSKNDAQVGRCTADSSTSKRKSALKRSHELSAANPNEERSVIIRGLHTVRRGINRLYSRS